MNIFFRELKANRKALTIWSIGVFLMVTSGMAKYSGWQSSGQSVNDLMSAVPKSIQSLLGIGAFDLTTAIGYYGMLFMYLAIMATIHASILGADIIAKEETDRTSEFLLVKPISRRRVVTEKILAALLNMIVFNLVTLFSSITIVSKYSKGGVVRHDILILMAGMFMLQLIFFSVGTTLAAMKKRPKTAGSITTGVMLATFFLSIAIDMNDKLDKLKYFTPFQYFSAKNLMNDGRFDPVFTLISVVLIVVLTTATYLFYDKKDLNI